MAQCHITNLDRGEYRSIFQARFSHYSVCYVIIVVVVVVVVISVKVVLCPSYIVESAVFCAG